MTPDGGPTRPPSVVDTIAAVATPSGRGGIGIVRLSGPHVPDIAARLGLQPLTPRHAHYRQFADNSIAELPAVIMSKTHVTYDFPNNAWPWESKATLTFKVNIGPQQAAGTYQNYLTFIALPSF